MRNPKASIIIITKNQRRFMERTLPMIFKQAFKDFEVIIVDSGSTDGALEVMEKYPVKIVKIPPDHFNYSRAFNIGAKEAKGEILVRLSGDCVPAEKNWLESLIEPFNESKIGASFGKYLYPNSPGEGLKKFWPKERIPDRIIIYSAKPGPLSGIKIGILEFGKTRNIDVFALAGGNCALRKSIWEKRPFNENLIAAEDAEYAWFLHIINYDIAYQPTAGVYHSHRNKLRQSFWDFIKTPLWQIIFNLEIIKYWLKRLLFLDPYRKFNYEAH
jgi:rhamnosyltransferase